MSNHNTNAIKNSNNNNSIPPVAKIKKLKENEKVAYMFESDIYTNEGERIEKTLPSKYNLTHKTQLGGYQYTRHINETDNGKDLRYKMIKPKGSSSGAMSHGEDDLSRLYADPYEENGYTGYDISMTELNDFDDAIRSRLLNNKEFNTKSPYSAVSEKNHYNPNIDKWNQSNYGNEEDRLQKLYLSKIRNVTNINSGSNANGNNSTGVNLFENIAPEMEKILKQHKFTREVLVYFLPKLQLDYNKRKQMSFQDFIVLSKKSGIFIDAKEKERSGISIVEHIQSNNKQHNNNSNKSSSSDSLLNVSYTIHLKFRFCEMQTEMDYSGSSSGGNASNAISESDFNYDVKQMQSKQFAKKKTDEKSSSSSSSSSSKNNNTNNVSNNNKKDIVVNEFDEYVELKKISTREMDDFMEDNLRLYISLEVMYNTDGNPNNINTRYPTTKIENINKVLRGLTIVDQYKLVFKDIDPKKDLIIKIKDVKFQVL